VIGEQSKQPAPGCGCQRDEIADTEVIAPRLGFVANIENVPLRLAVLFDEEPGGRSLPQMIPGTCNDSSNVSSPSLRTY